MRKVMLGYLFILISMWSCSNNIGKEDEVLEMFCRAEDKLIEYRQKIAGHKYDAVDDYGERFKLLNEYAPLLMSNTQKYKEGLLSLLTNSEFAKDSSTNEDIIFILHNLCLPEYIETCKEIYKMYRVGQIDIYALAFAIDPDYVISTKIVNNYRNPDLRKFYGTMLGDLKNSENKNEMRLSESLENILSGEAFNDSQFIVSITPPFIQDCDD